MLVDISKKNILIDLKYATSDNLTGQPIYDNTECFLHSEAVPYLDRAITLAAQQGLRLKVFDAYRPQRAQEKLWAICPNPEYIAPPERGSNHTRGVAIDLTLVDEKGENLDMGTPFDDLSPRAHHGVLDLPPAIALNRYRLLGIMMSAGWDYYEKEWWHYQLFKALQYPLVKELPEN